MIAADYLLIAGVLVVAGFVSAACRDRCPKHSDSFDALACSLCQIKMFRQQEINEWCAEFGNGRNGQLFNEERHDH
jgi:hypothetical protein